MNKFFPTERRSPTEAAQIAGVHVATVWRWILHGVRGRKLKSIRIGGRRFILDIDLQHFFDGGDQVARPQDLKDRAVLAGKQLDARGVSSKAHPPTAGGAR